MPQKQVKMSEKLLKNACFCGIIHRGMCTSEKFKQKEAYHGKSYRVLYGF